MLKSTPFVSFMYLRINGTCIKFNKPKTIRTTSNPQRNVIILVKIKPIVIPIALKRVFNPFPVPLTSVGKFSMVTIVTNTAIPKNEISAKPAPMQTIINAPSEEFLPITIIIKEIGNNIE